MPEAAYTRSETWRSSSFTSAAVAPPRFTAKPACFREMAAPLLTDRRFFLCGASFVLNFQHVTGVNGQTALLDNGQTVALPRSAATEFKKAWGNYWLTEGNA